MAFSGAQITRQGLWSGPRALYGSFVGKIGGEAVVVVDERDSWGPPAQTAEEVSREIQARDRRRQQRREEEERLVTELRARYEKAREVVLAQPEAQAADAATDDAGPVASIPTTDTPPADEIDWRAIVQAGQSVVAEFEAAIERIEAEARRRDDDDAAAVLLLMG